VSQLRRKPVEGAIMRICQSGENAGREYWVVNDGYGKTKFFEWVDSTTSPMMKKLMEINHAMERVEKKLDKSMRSCGDDNAGDEGKEEEY
jgi:hypothetical protein